MKNKITLEEFDQLLEKDKSKYLGRRFKVYGFGFGTVAVMGNKKSAVRVTLCKKHKSYLYLRSAWTHGDLASAYDKKGKYLGNLRDQIPFCPDCKEN